jgi:hypothetical protein
MVIDRQDELDEVFWAFTLAHMIEDLLDYGFSKKEIETAISEEIARVCKVRK